MLADLTSTQLSEWEAYEKVDPVGEFRGDARMAMLLSHITNLFLKRFGKKGVKETKPIDFMPQWDEKEQKSSENKTQSVEEMKNVFQQIASKFGRKKKDKKNNNKKKG
jgi:hypothetical protein